MFNIEYKCQYTPTSHMEKYTKGPEIGTGKLGSVYKAQTAEGKLFAIK